MDFLIYYSIGDPSVRQGMISCIGSISDKFYYCDSMVRVRNSDLADLTPADVILNLQDYFGRKRLERDDEVYLFFPDGKQLEMWRIKKKGRLRISKWQAAAAEVC